MNTLPWDPQSRAPWEEEEGEEVKGTTPQGLAARL